MIVLHPATYFATLKSPARYVCPFFSQMDINVAFDIFNTLQSIFIEKFLIK